MMSQLKLEHLLLPIRFNHVLTVEDDTLVNAGREPMGVSNVVLRIISLRIVLDGLL